MTASVVYLSLLQNIQIIHIKFIFPCESCDCRACNHIPLCYNDYAGHTMHNDKCPFHTRRLTHFLHLMFVIKDYEIRLYIHLDPICNAIKIIFLLVIMTAVYITTAFLYHNEYAQVILLLVYFVCFVGLHNVCVAASTKLSFPACPKVT